MDECPLCGKEVADGRKECPACGAPLVTDESVLESMETTSSTEERSSGGFAKFCLLLGMLASLANCVAAVVAGLFLSGRGQVLLGLIVAAIGFCVSMAQFVVFRKVRELYDFRPGSDAS